MDTTQPDLMDYAFPLYDYDFYFWIRKSKASGSLQWDIFLSPFDVLVWAALFSIGLFSAVFLWVFTKISSEELSPFMAVWLSLASFFGIVVEHESSRSSKRSPQRSPMSFAFSKYSPFKPFFDQAILRLQEKGVFQQIKQKWKKYTKYPCEEEATSSSEISLGKIALLLITLVSAIGLSLVILLCEYLTTKMKKNQITGPGLLFRRST